MPSQNYHRHCNRCKENSPCKRRHVYAMELDTEISKKDWFQEENPEYIEGKPCVYVGKTIHHPLCRKSMHLNCKTGEWKGKVWECFCHRKSGLNQCKEGNRSARRRIAEYMTGHLRPRLYKKFNPQRGPGNNAQAELDLALHLRGLGIGVCTDAKEK